MIEHPTERAKVVSVLRRNIETCLRAGDPYRKEDAVRQNLLGFLVEWGTPPHITLVSIKLNADELQRAWREARYT